MLSSGHKLLKQYIRNEKNEKIGVVVAIINDKAFELGWSVCNKHDEFNVELGTNLAIGRAFTGTKVEVPNRLVTNVIADENFEHLDFYEVEVNPVQRAINSIHSRASRYLDKRKQ